MVFHTSITFADAKRRDTQREKKKKRLNFNAYKIIRITQLIAVSSIVKLNSRMQPAARQTRKDREKRKRKNNTIQSNGRITHILSNVIQCFGV